MVNQGGSSQGPGLGVAADGALGRMEFHPVTAERWADLEKLFGKYGASGGCWCMWWRLARSEFGRLGSEGRRQGLKAIVDSGEPPGILAYADGEPVGWCSVGPREAFQGLERSRALRRIDGEPVWSVVCLFVARQFRRMGVSTRLLEAAVEYARRHGARIVEGYPVEPSAFGASDGSLYTGVASAFREAGFTEVARSRRQLIVRRSLVEDG